MTSGEVHRGQRELLGVHALGRLPEDEVPALQAHLDGCAACRAELAELRTTAALLDGADPAGVAEQVPVPPELGERVVAAVRAERETVLALPRRRVPRWVPLAAAAAVTAVVGVGIGYQLAPDVPVVPLEAVAVQAGPGSALDIAAGVVPHTWGMEIKLTGTGFAAGEDYQVRVLTDSGGTVAAGEFIGVGDSVMRCNLNSSVLRSDADGFEVLDSAGSVVLTSAL